MAQYWKARHLDGKSELSGRAEVWGQCGADPPRQWSISEVWRNHDDGEAVRAVIMQMDNADVDTLAREFGVSKTAMSIKLKSMGILPAWL